MRLFLSIVRPSLVRGLLLLFAGVALGACGSGEGEATLSPLQQELQDSANTWEALAIDDYTMQVTFRNGNWDPQVLRIRVEAELATIEDQSCFPERNCYERPLEAADFSVDVVIADVLAQAALNGVRHVVYNEDFGFPRIVEGAERSYELSDFKPLDD